MIGIWGLIGDKVWLTCKIIVFVGIPLTLKVFGGGPRLHLTPLDPGMEILANVTFTETRIVTNPRERLVLYRVEKCLNEERERQEAMVKGNVMSQNRKKDKNVKRNTANWHYSDKRSGNGHKN